LKNGESVSRDKMGKLSNFGKSEYVHPYLDLAILKLDPSGIHARTGGCSLVRSLVLEESCESKAWSIVSTHLFKASVIWVLFSLFRHMRFSSLCFQLSPDLKTCIPFLKNRGIENLGFLLRTFSVIFHIFVKMIFHTCFFSRQFKSLVSSHFFQWSGSIFFSFNWRDVTAPRSGASTAKALGTYVFYAFFAFGRGKKSGVVAQCSEKKVWTTKSLGRRSHVRKTVFIRDSNFFLVRFFSACHM
jgi:hypothetical protein